MSVSNKSEIKGGEEQESKTGQQQQDAIITDDSDSRLARYFLTEYIIFYIIFYIIIFFMFSQCGYEMAGKKSIESFRQRGLEYEPAK